MPRKKTPTTQKNEIDEIIDHLPGGNGFDAAGLLDAEESGDLDALDMQDALSDPPEQQAAGEDSPQDKPAPKKRSRTGTRKRSRRPEIVRYPLLPLRDMVIFPHMVTSLFVGRDKSLKAIESAMTGDRTLVAVAQRNPEDEDIAPEDLYDMGVEIVVGRSLKMPDGTVSLLVQGQRRVHVLRYTRTDPFVVAEGEVLEDTVDKSPGTEALMRAALSLFEKIVKLSPGLSEESYVAAMNVDEPGWLADLIASTVELNHESRQTVLQTADPIERLQILHLMLAKELDVLDLKNQIQDRVQSEVDKSQREFYLREQMKAIAVELQDFDPATREANDLRTRIETAGMPEEVQKKALDELERLQAMPMGMPEVGVIRTYLDWLLTLPWQQETRDHLNIKMAAQVLDANHYGLGKVKERILEYMAVRKLAEGKMRSPILCFVGPPGVGKTSLGRSIATALGRKFVRVSLGGIHDEAEIRGHRRTYIGALPGRIIQTMKTAGTVNPIFMMDEIDKVGADFRGDPSAALLEVLDPEQNYAFSDHYLDVPYNLSKVLFIMTANLLDPVPAALLDRMEVIELPGYIEEEKYHIAKQFLVPRQIEEHGLTPAHIKFADGTIRRLIREYTREAGVRNLEREIGTVCRKVAKQVAEQLPDDPADELSVPGEITLLSNGLTPGKLAEELNTEPLNEQALGIEVLAESAVSDMAPLEVFAVEETNGKKGSRIRARVVHERDLEAYLGPPRFDYGLAEEQDEVGVATGVSWTPVGGDTISVEVSLMEGKGALLLTGQLGDVMKESAQAALTYARSRARQLGIDPARFEHTDIHIHVPAAAIPKDGPSAGVTLATALVSALTGREVRRDVAMTGEITLRGKVLPIGGLKEKVLAAHRAGIATFVLPRKNEKDLNEIPQKVRRGLQMIPVDDLDAVLRIALQPLSGQPQSGSKQESPALPVKARTQRQSTGAGLAT